jgi:hypothetical protein
MIHLMDKAREICTKLENEGFGGVRFWSAKLEDHKIEDYDDEFTEESYAVYRRDLAYFIIDPSFPDCDCEESPYVEPAVFDADRFYRDLVAWVQGQVGEDVQVNFQEGCMEFELYRPREAVLPAVETPA